MPPPEAGRPGRRRYPGSVPSAYLDHAATTRVRPEAAAAFAEVIAADVGNPSGVHRSARQARRLLDDARDTMAELLGCGPSEIVFTSGGTEADDLAVRGVVGASGGRAVCSAVEHHAVLEPVVRGGGVLAAVDARGHVDADALAAQLDGSVALVSVMLVNNETGVVQPLGDLAELVRRRAPRAVLHTDAVQAFTWLDVADAAAHASLISVSGHKFGAPAGIGALAVRRGTPLRPQLLGGGQEHDRRSGTPNVAGAVAMAAAARAAAADRRALADRAARWREQLLRAFTTTVPGARPAVSHAESVPGIVNVAFEGVESEALLFLLDQAGVQASAGASCASGALDPSHVLAALGMPRRLARGSLRLSMGWSTTGDEIDLAIEAVTEAVCRLRSRS